MDRFEKEVRKATLAINTKYNIYWENTRENIGKAYKYLLDSKNVDINKKEYDIL